jgi:hypothetical protein
MSPPETKAISRRSGDSAGSDIAARGAGAREKGGGDEIRTAGLMPINRAATTDKGTRISILEWRETNIST